MIEPTDEWEHEVWVDAHDPADPEPEWIDRHARGATETREAFAARRAQRLAERVAWDARHPMYVRLRDDLPI